MILENTISTYFRQHPEILDELLESIDGQIYSYDYGIPIHIDSELLSMREMICLWLEKYGQHIKYLGWDD